MEKKTYLISSSSRWIKLGFLFCFLTLGVIGAKAQEKKTITGHVQDTNKEPLASVSVVVKGTTSGTMTDIDGNYSLNVKTGDVVSVLFMGMKTQEFTVGSNNQVNITLEDNLVALGGNDGVTVVGYGSAQIKDLTSKIPTVKGEDLAKQTSSNPMSGMQGKVAGVQIVNSGVPGESPTVRIRGVSHFSKDDTKAEQDKQGPLYVVDGMLFDDIAFLSSSDIESMSVLKDASSAAIYGVRAANGVVIITTKKGIKNTKPTVTYDGYVGFQQASNLVKMANSKEYVQLMTEAGQQDASLSSYLSTANNSIALYGGSNGVPSVNTDWYDELLRTAAIQNHSVNISGGTENITYVIGANYLNQNGIANADNGYDRTNVRSKLDVQATKWLKVGANIAISSSQQKQVDLSAFDGAFQLPSFVPVYDENNTQAFPIKYASPTQLGFSGGFFNPMATLRYRDGGSDGVSPSVAGGSSKVNQILPSFYAQFNLLKDKLTLRSSFNQDIKFFRNTHFTPEYSVGGNQVTTQSAIKKTDEYTNNWVIDNVATYRDNWNLHSVTGMLGTSIRRERWEQLQGTATNVPSTNPESEYISQGSSTSRIASDGGSEYRGLSYFGRGMYNYADKYLLSATLRADGSSKYQEQWGYFPSVGLGWVISKELFLKNQKVFSNIKIRANWGQLGNDKIPANDGFASITQNDQTSGIFNGTIYPGYTNVSYFSSLKWEVVTETDFGVDFTTLRQRLDGSFDYYNRKTTNAVFSKPLPNGAGNLLVNNGSVENSGVELTLNWSDKVGKDFHYNIGFNLSTLRNRVTSLDGLNTIYTGTAEYQKIRRVGLPVDSYLGYKVVGVYQNQAQIDADPLAVKNNLIPGDLIFQHQEGASDLTDADKVILGSPTPNVYLGGNVGFGYKNWDFNLAFQGQYGAKIVNVKRFGRRYQIDMNFDKDLVKNHWTGEGSTNSYPSAAGLLRGWNYSNFSSFMVESGNTFTIQNVQLGYTFKNIFPSSDNASLRLSLTAQRPLSIFKYNGFSTDYANGYDTNVYPLSSSYSFGVKLIF